MIRCVVSLLIVVVFMASTALLENMLHAKEFYLGVPHDKNSSQVKVTDKQVLDTIARHGEIQAVVDVDEPQFWEAVETNLAFYTQVLDSSLYYARPVVRHVPARDDAPESFLRTLFRFRVVKAGEGNASGKGMSSQGLANEVTIRWQAKDGVDPQGMLPAATTYVAALNQNQLDKALECVYKDQRDSFGDNLRRNRRMRQLVVDGVTVFREDYNMEGGKVRDLLMAKVHTREVGGEGGMSFLMIRFGDTWWIVGG